MDELILYVGNKNYSSWSLRPWIALKAGDVPFRDVVVPFDFPNGNPQFRPLSPTGRVPVLHHGQRRIWESLAIIEYAAELFPGARLWPADPGDRAVARSISMEMLSGFRSLRNACPMNIRRPVNPLALDPETAAGVAADVARIETIWREALQASGGPFLFGRFSAADAMYAPVVNRFEIYALTEDAGSRAYMQAVKTHPAFLAWQADALQEPWIVPEDEA